MATVSFTSALQRFLPAPPAKVAGGTVGAALAVVFASRPALRGYVLDDQGALRRHVAVYVNGQPVHDRVRQLLIIAVQAGVTAADQDQQWSPAPHHVAAQVQAVCDDVSR